MTTFDDNQLTFFDNQFPQSAVEFASYSCDSPQPAPELIINAADRAIKAEQIETPASTGQDHVALAGVLSF